MPVLRYYTMMLHKPESHTGHDIIQMSIILSPLPNIRIAILTNIFVSVRKNSVRTSGDVGALLYASVPFAQCNWCNAMFCSTDVLYKCNTLFSGIVEGELFQRNSTSFYQGRFWILPSDGE